MKEPARLVAVSNRVGPVRGAAAAGGLAVGLVDVLRERGGLWFGWSGKTTAAGRARLHVEKTEGITCATPSSWFAHSTRCPKWIRWNTTCAT